MAEQHRALRRHEVDAVFELVRRRNDVFLILVDALAEESPVEPIRDQKCA